LPKGHAKARIVPVRFDPELYRAVTMAAKSSKQSVSEWIRNTVEAATK
jgi:predicted HicB family RNase H-like nuclease